MRVLWLLDVPKGQKPTSARGLHFDYADDDHHPVFHVQVDDHVLSPEDIKVPYEGNPKRVETPRIPTAPMDLIGAVYMILHDHFSPSVMEGWSEECRQAIDSLPLLPCAPITEQVKTRGRLSCDFWYPQHVRGYSGRPKAP